MYPIITSNFQELDFVPLSLSSLMMCANSRLHYVATVVFVCLHIAFSHNLHYTAVSENIPKAHSVACVSMIKSVLLIIFMEYIGLFVFSLPTPLVMIMTIRVLYPIIIIKFKAWIICYCLELDHETVVHAVYSKYKLHIGPIYKMNALRPTASNSKSW